MTKRIFGHIDGFPPGFTFADRQEVHVAGIHRPLQAGISGSQNEGADSIVLSGGYEDDEDHGDDVVYTGHGGQHPTTKQQVSDQKLTKGNLALVKNMTRGLPVRVTRGAKLDSPHAPPIGYRYDGLYRVDEYHWKTGKSGHRVIRFRLVRVEGQEAIPAKKGVLPAPPGNESPGRKQGMVTRVIRDTSVGRAVKELHDYRCQVCGVRLEGPGGPYAEAAHIRPLGRPHNGPDVMENVLCLCPNHHVLFDLHSFSVGEDLRLQGAESWRLRMVREHSISQECLAYHRKCRSTKMEG